ncbi:MAG: MFS transporter [Chloroflexi bacterium]|nr:MFS transporter [Chloroflexota bacterium]
METLNQSGYAGVLKNRNFLAIWLAQVLSNTALNGSFFLQIILIEEVTHSSAQIGAVILAFALPAVLLSAVAGMVVDRMSKKTILVWSNGLRVITGVVLAVVAAGMHGGTFGDGFFLVAIYVLVFIGSAIGQFFAPAEGATIPLIVRSDNLLPANSLFTMTFTGSQILGMIILAPLGVKTIGIVGSFWVAALMYLGATIFVWLLPRDRPVRPEGIAVSAVHKAWSEIVEGWQFAIHHRAIFIALLQLALTSTLTMIMADLAPGFAKRVLGLSAEDATYVFWPAGVGMLLSSVLIGRFGHRIPRELLASIGIAGVAVGLAGLAWAGGGSIVFGRPLFVEHPEWMLTTSAMVMIFALVIGMMMAAINIPAQTIVQERSNDAVRGRVLAVQFTLSNAIGIPPTLFIGGLADVFSIPTVTLGISVIVALLAIVNLSWAISTVRLARLRHSNQSRS